MQWFQPLMRLDLHDVLEEEEDVEVEIVGEFSCKTRFEGTDYLAFDPDSLTYSTEREGVRVFQPLTQHDQARRIDPRRRRRRRFNPKALVVGIIGPGAMTRARQRRFDILMARPAEGTRSRTAALN